MEKVWILKGVKAFILCVIVSFALNASAVVFGEDASLMEQEAMIEGLDSYEEIPSVIIAESNGISPQQDIHHFMICFGCNDYICIGFGRFYTLTSNYCYGIAFCIAYTDGTAECVGLLPFSLETTGCN